MTLGLQLLYLVLASSGMHDDRAQWTVAAFFSMDDALLHCTNATQASKAAVEAYKLTPEGKQSSYLYFSEPTLYDLGHTVRDGDVRYYVEAVPLVQGALGESGLLAIAEALGSASAVAHEASYPGQRQRMRLPEAQLPADVKSDFASKLMSALS